MSGLNPPLTARKGSILKVLGIARISTEHQDERSLQDQEALYRQWLDQHADLKYELTMISGRGSGESLDRMEAQQAWDEVETATYDLVIAEDIGRIVRRVHAHLFCERCEDVGTRLIAINDHVDTGSDSWRLHSMFAAMRHEMYNADTGKRIRRSLRNRFTQGGIIQCMVFGIIKPPGCKSDSELQKDPAAQPIYDEMFRRLEDGASYSEVADWLNEKGVPLPPYARASRWKRTLVCQLIHNPILKGVRVRNRKISKRFNQTGRHKSINAPLSERLERHCPHLAFIDPARYDWLIHELDLRNAKYRRQGVNGIDTRKNVPRKKTIWPGQHIVCGVCGRPLVYGGHGQKDHLICKGAVEYRCWNSATVDGPLAAQKMLAAMTAEITALPDFDANMTKLVEEALRQQHGTRDLRRQEFVRRLTDIERGLSNLAGAIRERGHSQVLLDDLARLEGDKAQIQWEIAELGNSVNEPVTLPPAGEIRQLAQKSLEKLAITSQEFGRLMRRLIFKIVVHPFHHFAGGSPVLRGSFTVDLVKFLPTALESHMGEVLSRALVVDLFDRPQWESFRIPIAELSANGLKQREIAWELQLTQPVVQRSLLVSRRMTGRGLIDPYLPMTGPLEGNGRFRRHLHPRYRFEPLNRES
jgi:DNA invertase Pin-like site-specific DNA recombinase